MKKARLSIRRELGSVWDIVALANSVWYVPPPERLLFLTLVSPQARLIFVSGLLGSAHAYYATRRS